MNDRGRKGDIQEDEGNDLVVFGIFENQFLEHVSQNNDQDKGQCLEENDTHEHFQNPGNSLL